MPSSMTHTYFSQDVLEKTNENIKNKINKSLELYKLFAQGSDPFMFNNFFIGANAKKYMKIQETMHCTKTKDFFVNTIKYIHENKLVNNSECMSFLYGYICHYVLDSFTHPYLYYYSGVFNKKNKKTRKYNCVHQEIEYLIDSYMIRRKENINPIHYKVYQNIFKIQKFSKELENLITNSIEGTYKYKNIINIYHNSIKDMKLFFLLVNNDPYGIKYNIYSFIDKLTGDNHVRLKILSYYNFMKSNRNYLNLENDTWTLPWDKEITSTASFNDLYESAIKEAKILIEKIEKYINEETLDIQKIEELFPNISYKTGIDAKVEVNMKYFAF